MINITISPSLILLNKLRMTKTWESCSIFGGLILLPSYDTLLSARNLQDFRSESNRENFQTIILAMTVVINLYFVALWIYYFVMVQIRVHFTLIQRILKCFSIDLEDIEDYEQDLQRWNQLQEKLKKT